MTRPFRFAVDHYLVLPLGASVALAWANTMAPSYFTVAHHLSFVVNDVGVSLFFALTILEVLQVVSPGLALQGWRGFTLALVAAVGGILGAGVAYVGWLSVSDEASVLSGGWPIVCATDIAFTYFIASRMCARPAIPFLLLIGVVSNGIGLVALEFLYPIGEAHGSGALLVMAAIIGAFVLQRCDVRSFWPYLIGCGGLSWCGLFQSGLHPALALAPIAPFLSRTSIAHGFMVGAPSGAHDALSRLQNRWMVPLQLLLFLFGLTNAGVVVRAVGTGTWALTFATLTGRPAGTLLALGIAAAAGLRLPRGVGWRDMVVVAVVSGMGFTFALFFATVTFPVGPVLNEVKLGALMTVGVSLLTIAAARVLRVGRFAQPVTPRQAPAPECVGV